MEGEMLELGEKIRCKCGSQEFRVYEVEENGETVGHTFKCAACGRWYEERNEWKDR